MLFISVISRFSHPFYTTVWWRVLFGEFSFFRVYRASAPLTRVIAAISPTLFRSLFSPHASLSCPSDLSDLHPAPESSHTAFLAGPRASLKGYRAGPPTCLRTLSPPYGRFISPFPVPRIMGLPTAGLFAPELSCPPKLLASRPNHRLLYLLLILSSFKGSESPTRGIPVRWSLPAAHSLPWPFQTIFLSSPGFFVWTGCYFFFFCAELASRMLRVFFFCEARSPFLFAVGHTAFFPLP